MKVESNDIIWSKELQRYVQPRNGKIEILPDKWRHLERLDTPPVSNTTFGRSCFKCQGFIHLGEVHICKEVKPIYDDKKGVVGFSYETC